MTHEFKMLFDRAISRLNDCRFDNDMQQIIVCQSLHGRIYNVVIPDVAQNEDRETDKLIAEISSVSDVIQRIVCVWNNGTIDLPSFQFRQKLYQQNEENGNAEILLKGLSTYCIKMLKETLS